MGRRGPTPNPQMFRKQRGIRFSDDEWSQVKQNAQAENKNVSTYVREKALKKSHLHLVKQEDSF